MTKRIYIFDYVGGITDNYHDGGGLAIVTDTGDPVQFFRDSFPELDPEFADAKEVSYLLANPDAKEEIHIFPDSGCC